MRIGMLSLFLLLWAGHAAASQPGQPLDCSDWVFVEPGLSCDYWAHYPCPSNLEGCTGGADLSLDNLGRVLKLSTSVIGSCGTFSVKRWTMTAYDGVTTTVLGYLDERCNAVGIDFLEVSGPGHYFREENGEWVYSRLTSRCSAPYPQVCNLYADTFWRPVFRGFATEFEILQSFTPSASLGFQVPVMPDGLPAADSFDTYYGALTHPINFSDMKGLRCSYPATTPKTGDFLEAIDDTPLPPPGQGYFFVTAAHHQGQTRYGRKRSGGTMSGRDPSVLPACSTDR